MLISDLHLVVGERESYRWGLFPFIRDIIEQHSVDTLVCLGDLTDRKDYHPADLVNRVVGELDQLKGCLGEGIILLKGNHDYLRDSAPFFKFMNKMGVTYVDEQMVLGDVLFLPHTFNPEKDWKGLDFSKYRAIFMHQTVSGARASNGMPLAGVSSKMFGVPVFSGDIHVPQKVGDVTYVGSPYHVHFGDNFKPRCLLLDHGAVKAFYFKTVKRVAAHVRSLEEFQEDYNLSAGDQVKVTLTASNEAYPELAAGIHNYCKNNKIQLCGMTFIPVESRRKILPPGQRGDPRNGFLNASVEETLRLYCDRQGLSDSYFQAGLRIIQEEG